MNIHVRDHHAEPSMAFMTSPAFRAMSMSGHLVLARVVLGLRAGRDTITNADLQAFGVHRHRIKPAIRELEALGIVTAQRQRENIGAATFALSHRWRNIRSVEQAKVIARAARRKR